MNETMLAAHEVSHNLVGGVKNTNFFFCGSHHHFSLFPARSNLICTEVVDVLHAAEVKVFG